MKKIVMNSTLGHSVREECEAGVSEAARYNVAVM